MMNMINNYLSNLESYLPQEMRQEVRDELEGSILGQLEDKAEQLGREPNEQEQAEILLNIGHPMRVAASFQPNQQLIGAELFPMFKKALQLTLILLISIQLVLNAPYLFTSENFIGYVIRTIADIFDTALWGFGLVTMVFYILQSNNINLDKLYAWSPKTLTEKTTNLPVSRFETLFEIAVEMIFLAWWNNFFSWPAVYDGTVLSFSAEWANVFWPVNIVMGIAIAINLHKLWIAGWNNSNRFANILLNIAILGIVIHMFSFENYLLAAPNEAGAKFPDSILEIFNNGVSLVLWIVVFTNILEILLTVKRLLKK